MAKRPTLVALSEKEKKLVSEVDWKESFASESESESEWKVSFASESNNHCQVRGKESALTVLMRTNPKSVTLMPGFQLLQDKILNMKVKVPPLYLS